MFVFKDQLKSLAKPFGELNVESTADLEQVFPTKTAVQSNSCFIGPTSMGYGGVYFPEFSVAGEGGGFHDLGVKSLKWDIKTKSFSFFLTRLTQIHLFSSVNHLFFPIN